MTRLHDATYARAVVVPNTTVDRETHTAVVTFELRPGAPTTFGSITIEGEELVKERAIRRQLRIRQGRSVSGHSCSMRASMPSTGLGMFQAVTPRVLNPDEQGAPMDVEITVRERKPRSVQVGFGFSTVEQFRGEVQWTNRNLWGGAEQLNLSGKASSIQQAAEARFFLPYFLTRRTSFAQTAFARNQPSIDQDVLGLGGVPFSASEYHAELFAVQYRHGITRQA